jgi:hypothetical protein
MGSIVVPGTLTTKMVDAVVNRFSRVLFTWLRFLGRLRLPVRRLLPIVLCLNRSLNTCGWKRGFRREPIRSRHWYIEDFLGWFFRDHNSLRQITITDVDEAMTRKGRDDGYARLSIQAYASNVRSFLRYAESKGWCTQGLAALVASPRVYRHENLPVGSILERCTAPYRRHRGISTQGYSGSRHSTSPGRLRPAIRRSAGPEAGRFRLGKGVTFRLTYQRPKARTLSSLAPPSAKPSSAISEKRARSLCIEKSF